MTISYATYCIIDSDRPIPAGIVGLHACTASNLPYRGIGVVTSVLERPVSDVVAGSVEHETVVEQLMPAHTVLPMRFPTVFESREAIVAMMVQHYDDFRKSFWRVRGRVEFGVKAAWPQPSPHADSRDTRPMQGTTTGTLYMQQRYHLHKRRQVLQEQTAQLGRELDAVLSEVATEKRLRNHACDRLAFDGVYLVDRDKTEAFRRAFSGIRDAQPGLRYLLSGPWPPYNFVGLRPDGCRELGNPKSPVKADE